MLSYGFYNSLNGDRKYDAAQMSAIFNGIINDGVFMSVGNYLITSPAAGMIVNVGTGRAWFNSTWTYNSSAYAITVDAAEAVLDRIDTIVLEINTTDEVRANSIKIVKGTPDAAPIAPTLTNDANIHQYPLCDIYVAAGVTEILEVDITNRVGTVDCPFITGILETVDTSALLAQWEAEFDTFMLNNNSEFTTFMNASDSEFHEWFQGVQDILDETAEGNILSMIGDITLLTTDDKTSLANAINEVNGDINNIDLTGIGRTNSAFGFTGATVTDVTDTDGSVELDAGQVTGTIEKIYYRPNDIIAWRNLKVEVSNLDANNTLEYSLVDRLTTKYRTALDTSFSVSAQATSPTDVKYNFDGSIGYVLNAGDDTIYQYTLSTPNDWGTAVYSNKSFSVAAQESTPYAIYVKDDSTFYVLGATNKTVCQYTMTAGDISTSVYASKSFSVGAEVTTPNGLFFNSDGTKCYVVDASTNVIYQYGLITGWDAATGSYDSKSLNLAGNGIAMKNGFLELSNLKLFVSGGGKIGQYDLSVASDIATGTLDSIVTLNSLNGDSYGIDFNSGGTKLIMTKLDNTDTTVCQYDTSGVYRLDEYSEDTDTTIVVDTEITSNGINIIDLSTIDLTTYPNDLVLTYTLSRILVGDTSPIVGGNSITWEGEASGVWVELDSDETTEDASSLNIQVPYGYEEYRLVFYGKTVNNRTTLNLSVNDIVSSTYRYIKIYQSDNVDAISNTSLFIISGVNQFSTSNVLADIVIRNNKLADWLDVETLFRPGANASIMKVYGTCWGESILTSVAISSSASNVARGASWKLYGRNL